MFLLEKRYLLRGLTITELLGGRKVVAVFTERELLAVLDYCLFFQGDWRVTNLRLLENEEFELGFVCLDGFLALSLVHVDCPQFVVVLPVDEVLHVSERDVVSELDERPNLLHSVVN